MKICELMLSCCFSVVDMNVSREINIDKVCTWKPFFKIMQNKGPVIPLVSEKRSEVGKRTIDGTRGLELFMVGYEVFTDGFTRVLRICERPDGYKKEKLLLPSSNMQFRVSYFAIHLLENGRQVRLFSSHSISSRCPWYLLYQLLY